MSAYFNAKRKLRRKLLHRLKPCQEMVPLMSESLDRRLNLPDRLKLKLHLMICAWCTRYLYQVKLIARVLELRTDECDVPSVELSKEARERIRRSLNEHQ